MDKPENCACEYPRIVYRNMSGHAEYCPIHIEFLEKLKTKKNPVTKLVSNLLEEIKQNIISDYETTHNLNDTYFYLKGYIEGLGYSKVFTKDEISLLKELNRDLLLKYMKRKF